MAAILCESISKLLHGTCDAVCTVLTLPCKACGIATDQISDLCRSPFCLYLSVAVGLNLPPVIFTGRSLGYDDCNDASNWMKVNALLCVINIMAAVYISLKITRENDANDAPFIEANVTNNADTAKPSEKNLVKTIFKNAVLDNTRSKSLSRVREILCYDPLVALYIIIGIFFIVWQTMGVGKMGCGGDVDTYLSHSLMCGYLFIVFGGMTFACSLCCLVRW